MDERLIFIIASISILAITVLSICLGVYLKKETENTKKNPAKAGEKAAKEAKDKAAKDKAAALWQIIKAAKDKAKAAKDKAAKDKAKAAIKQAEILAVNARNKAFEERRAAKALLDRNKAKEKLRKKIEMERESQHKLVFAGDCDGARVAMGKKTGTREQVISKCSTACQKGLTMKGFIVNKIGLCFCEPTDSATCRRIKQTPAQAFQRFDWLPKHIQKFQGRCNTRFNGRNNIMMFNDNNPGKTHEDKVRICSESCLLKSTPFGTQKGDFSKWNEFEATGFIVDDVGRCYCEGGDSAKCEVQGKDSKYYRYDWKLRNQNPYIQCGLRKKCCNYKTEYGVIPGKTWGTLPLNERDNYNKGCDMMIGKDLLMCKGLRNCAQRYGWEPAFKDGLEWFTDTIPS